MRTIAVDGPAGVGKSTVGKHLADHHGYLFLDTGVLYRAVSLVALQHGVSPADQASLVEIASDLDIQMARPEPGSDRMYCVCLDGEDVTDRLRSAPVERIVSEVSAHPRVRAQLLERQREIARSHRSVLVGRDIGTVVLPDADLKIYLDASLDERAARRHRELRAKGRDDSYNEVVEELKRRDKIDTERASSPLRVPPDAYVVDTDGKDVDTVLLEIESRLEEEWDTSSVRS